MGRGFLKIELFTGDHALPVQMDGILVKDTKGKILYELSSDENGMVPEISLAAPDKESTMVPNAAPPYFGAYDIEVSAGNGYKRAIIRNVEIFDTITTVMPIQLYPVELGGSLEQNTSEIVIPLRHGVDMERNVQPLESSEDNPVDAMEKIIADEVAIPQYMTVHLGSPNAVARNVRVPFSDYIKNVASSEIFPTWEEPAIIANIYAQISFALNRVYTVWYRSRGFDFDITNSTAFDQFFVEGRDIFQNISRIVDNIFNNFIRRQGRKEPFFAQYCSGTTVTCAGMSQWGSQSLALNQGYTPIQILRYYYPKDVQIVESNNFTGDVGTYPGTSLKEGSSGPNVRRMQLYLNRISGNFYIPPIPVVDGVFGSATKNTVIEFQKINNLIPDGIIGKSTWYKITQIYVGVAQLAELTSEGERLSIGAVPPTSTLTIGARGEDVVELQFLLNYISLFYPTVPFVIQNGVFRDDTKRGVIEFQKTFGLTYDGVVGPATWRKLYDVYKSIQDATLPPPGGNVPEYPGTPLRVGARGDAVRFMQESLNDIAKVYPAIPTLTADGVFGTNTQAAVRAFQSLFGLTPDGVIGPQTWYKIVDVRRTLPTIAVPQFPGTALRVGSRGNDVTLMQKYLNTIAASYPSIPRLTADGIFGPATEAAVRAFQSNFGLGVDGVLGRNTWNMIVSVYNRLLQNVASVSSASHAGTRPKAYNEMALLLLTFSMLRRY